MAATQERIHCTQCGVRLPTTARFCKRCGHAVAEDVPSSPSPRADRAAPGAGGASATAAALAPGAIDGRNALARCGECGMALEPGSPVCAHCGTLVPPANAGRCKDCKVSLTFMTPVCPRCGTPDPWESYTPSVATWPRRSSALPRPTRAAAPVGPGIGTHLGLIAALLALVGFALPWVSAFGFQLSGLDFATQPYGTKLLFALPLMALLLIVAVMRRYTSAAGVSTGQTLAGIGGAVVSGVAIFEVLAQRNQLPFGAGGLVSVDVGAWLPLTAFILAVAGGMLQRSEDAAA